MTNKKATARRTDMLRMLLHWVLNAAALLIVAHFVNGFVIDGLKSALFAVVVIGFLNATVGLLLKFITRRVGILPLGFFFLLIKAVFLKSASHFVPGFQVQTFK